MIRHYVIGRRIYGKKHVVPEGGPIAIAVDVPISSSRKTVVVRGFVAIKSNAIPAPPQPVMQYSGTHMKRNGVNNALMDTFERIEKAAGAPYG